SGKMSNCQMKLTSRTHKSQIKDAEGNARILRLEQRETDIVNTNTSRSASFRGAVMSVAVDDQVSAVAIHHFGEPRSAEIRINFCRLPLNSCHNRSVVHDDNSLLGPQLGHGSFQF